MWIGIFLIFVGFIVDAIALNARGKFVALIFIIVALGFAGVGLRMIPTTNPTQVPAVIITSPSGNTVIQAYNITQAPTNSTTGFAVAVAELNLIIQFGLVMLIIGYLFFERNEKKKKRMNQ